MGVPSNKNDGNELEGVEEGEFDVDISKNEIEKCRWLRFGCGRLRVEINPVVTLASAVIIWGLVIWCMVKPEQAFDAMIPWNPWITKNFAWLYMSKCILNGI